LVNPETPGEHVLEFDFHYDSLGAGTLAFNNLSGIGRSGTGVLKVDGNVVASQKMERTLPLILQWDENFDVVQTPALLSPIMTTKCRSASQVSSISSP
jgi:arylsulfatase